MTNINSQYLPEQMNAQSANTHGKVRTLESDVTNFAERNVNEFGEASATKNKSYTEITNSTALNFNLVFRSLNQHLSENVVNADSLQIGKQVDNKLIQSDSLTNAVMQSLEKRIDGAKSRGANSDELASLINHTLNKINAGFDSAKSEISELGVGEPNALNEINQSQDKINAAVNTLTDELSQQTSAASSSKIAEINTDSSSLLDLVGEGLNQLQVSNSNYSSQTKTSDLTIKTADGDLVTIKFFDQQTSASSEQFSYQGNSEQQQSFYQQSNSASQSSHFSFSIEGEIDDEEYAAISSLVNDIQTLQEEFFNGDIMIAYEQALTLGFDDEELAGFSLDLTKSVTHIASETYNAVAQLEKPESQQGTAASDVKSEFSKLLGFIDQIKQLQESANQVLAEGRTEALNIISKTVDMGSTQNTVTLTQFEQFYQKFSYEKLADNL